MEEGDFYNPIPCLCLVVAEDGGIKGPLADGEVSNLVGRVSREKVLDARLD